MAIHIFLFDAEGKDRELSLAEASQLSALHSDGSETQLLWIDLEAADAQEQEQAFRLLDLPPPLRQRLRDTSWDTGTDETPGQGRPQLDLYASCFHINVQAVQVRQEVAEQTGRKDRSLRGSERVSVDATERGTRFQFLTIHFVVQAGVVLTLHREPAAFLHGFAQRIKGDSHLGILDSPAFLGALLNGHVTGYFRAMETIENEVDRIDDAALRLRRVREEKDLLRDMVRVRRRLARVRRTLLPHREVYATLARPQFAPFVTEQATITLGLVNERLERAIEATENAREQVLGSFDIFSTQTALRTNEVVKTLTVLSALLLPAGVLATLSTLFIRAPVYDEGRAGFWIMLLGMVAFGTTFLAIARRRRWL